MQTKITSYTFHQQGKRLYQEDYFYSNQDIGLFIVCDGVGGAAKGEVASRFVIDWLVSHIVENKILPVDKPSTQLLIQKAQEAILQRLNEHPEEEGMGTTLAMIYFHAGGATLAHIGDSRIYFIQPKWKRYWRTKDHSVVQELVDSGIIKEAAMSTHPMRNRITRAIQASKDSNFVKADIKIIKNWSKGDLFFLCTDGVLEAFNEEALLRILAHSNDSEEQRLSLIKLECEKTSRDNNSGILIALDFDSSFTNEVDLIKRNIYE